MQRHTEHTTRCGSDRGCRAQRWVLAAMACAATMLALACGSGSLGAGTPAPEEVLKGKGCRGKGCLGKKCASGLTGTVDGSCEDATGAVLLGSGWGTYFGCENGRVYHYSSYALFWAFVETDAYHVNYSIKVLDRTKIFLPLSSGWESFDFGNYHTFVGGTDCVEYCKGRACGAPVRAPSGFSCGTCDDSWATCNDSGQCVPRDQPKADCTGKVCGSDGAGGSCGTCGAGADCNAVGQCVCPADMFYDAGSCVPVPVTPPVVSCANGSCSSSSQQILGSADTSGYYRCDGACYQWVNCAPGQAFNGATCAATTPPVVDQTGNWHHKYCATDGTLYWSYCANADCTVFEDRIVALGSSECPQPQPACRTGESHHTYCAPGCFFYRSSCANCDCSLYDDVYAPELNGTCPGC